MTQQEVLNALSQVQEPDLGKDLVTLNMIRDLTIEGKRVSFTIVLTTPACPMKDLMKNASVNAIRLLVDKEADVTVNFTSQTTSQRADNGQVLPGVRNIITVVSGKGGVGKSTVSANFALALAESGARVGLMDADIYGPSQHIMFGIRGERPLMTDDGSGKGKILPIERFGIKVMSIGLLVDEKQAVVWRGPMVSSAIRQFITDVHWGELDYLVIDMPPGTGDIHLTIIGKPRAGASADLIESLGLHDCITYVSGVSDERIVELYAESTLAVVPSLYEGFSLPSIEAMSTGICLVATTGGALPEVTGRDGETVLSCPPGDAEALAAALRRGLDDQALREKIGDAGRRRVVERWSWRHCASLTVDQYREVLLMPHNVQKVRQRLEQNSR
jgi:Mrp family chromosome partitioning ATPase